MCHFVLSAKYSWRLHLFLIAPVVVFEIPYRYCTVVQCTATFDLQKCHFIQMMLYFTGRYKIVSVEQSGKYAYFVSLAFMSDDHSFWDAS